MDKLSYLHRDEAHPAEDRREALQWLARQLRWEQRLGQLRPGGSVAKQAA